MSKKYKYDDEYDDDEYDDDKELKRERHKNIIKSYTIDLIAKAKKHPEWANLMPRMKEINELLMVLNKPEKNTPVLVGLAGVGKTAIIEYLAYLIAHKKLNPIYNEYKIYSLSFSNLIAGCIYRGMFEQRLSNLIHELEQDPNIILFIDEFHTISNKRANAAPLEDPMQVLKPYLARGELKIIGATTPQEYEDFINTDPAFSRRVNKIVINELNKTELINLIQNTFKADSDIISTDLIKQAITLADTYITNTAQPDRTIDLLQEALISYKNQNSGISLEQWQTYLHQTITNHNTSISESFLTNLQPFYNNLDWLKDNKIWVELLDLTRTQVVLNKEITVLNNKITSLGLMNIHKGPRYQLLDLAIEKQNTYLHNQTTLKILWDNFFTLAQLKQTKKALSIHTLYERLHLKLNLPAEIFDLKLWPQFQQSIKALSTDFIAYNDLLEDISLEILHYLSRLNDHNLWFLDFKSEDKVAFCKALANTLHADYFEFNVYDEDGLVNLNMFLKTHPFGLVVLKNMINHETVDYISNILLSLIKDPKYKNHLFIIVNDVSVLNDQFAPYVTTFKHKTAQNNKQAIISKELDFISTQFSYKNANVTFDSGLIKILSTEFSLDDSLFFIKNVLMPDLVKKLIKHNITTYHYTLKDLDQILKPQKIN